MPNSPTMALRSRNMSTKIVENELNKASDNLNDLLQVDPNELSSPDLQNFSRKLKNVSTDYMKLSRNKSSQLLKHGETNEAHQVSSRRHNMREEIEQAIDTVNAILRNSDLASVSQLETRSKQASEDFHTLDDEVSVQSKVESYLESLSVTAADPQDSTDNLTPESSTTRQASAHQPATVQDQATPAPALQQPLGPHQSTTMGIPGHAVHSATGVTLSHDLSNPHVTFMQGLVGQQVGNIPHSHVRKSDTTYSGYVSRNNTSIAQGRQVAPSLAGQSVSHFSVSQDLGMSHVNLLDSQSSMPNSIMPTQVNSLITCTGRFPFDQQHSVVSNPVVHSLSAGHPIASTNHNAAPASNPFFNVHAKPFSPQVPPTNITIEQKASLPGYPTAHMMGSQYLNANQMSYQNLSNTRNNLLPSHSKYVPDHGYNVPLGNHIDNQNNLIAKHLLTQGIARNPIDLFDGTAHRFWGWIDQITARISGLNLSPPEILNVIESNCKDEPKRMITSYKAALGTIDEFSFQRIWDTLVERFGSSQETARQLLEKLKKFPQIKGTSTGKQLRELYDLCIIIEFNKARCPELSIMDLAAGCRQVIEKLPKYLIDRWCVHGQNYEDINRGRHPPFSLCAEFLLQQSRRLNNSHYDYLAPEKKEVKVMATTATTATSNDSDKHCPMHKVAGHNLTDCIGFRKLSTLDKQNKLKELKLCFLCFGSHLRSACKENITCNKCQKSHHTLLHRDYTPKSSTPDGKNEPSSEEVRDSSDKKSLCTRICHDAKAVKNCSKTILVEVMLKDRPDLTLRCYAIVDEHSDTTIVDPKVPQFFGVKFPTVEYSLRTVNGSSTKMKGMLVSGLAVKGVGEKTRIKLPPAITNSSIPDTKHEVATPQIVEAHRHIKRYASAFHELDNESEVLLLIGRDCGAAMTTRCFGGKSPWAHKTPLGWAIVGITCVTEDDVERPFNVLKTRVNLDHEHLRASLTHPTYVNNNYDVFRCNSDDNAPGLSADDRTFLDIMETGIDTTSTGHLQVPLPFRNNELLPDNRTAVFHRTKNTLNRLRKDPDKIKQCITSMEKSLAAGHVEVVPKNEVIPPRGRAWWIPIFPVDQPKKNKVRLVYDASAKYKEISLNDRLLTGPDHNNALKGVLLRFREEKIAIAADIQHMFSNYYVPPEQRDFLRYYWFKNNDPQNELIQYRSCSHIFGCSSSPAVANFCLRYAARTLNDEQEEVKSFLSSSFYVDDALHSVATSDEATAVLQGAIDALKMFNTRLHKIVSNCETVLKAFPLSERAEASLHLDVDKVPTQKTLGVGWNPEEDTFVISVQIPDRPFTKRGILAVLHTTYDPLGFVAPVTLAGRLIQRKILPPKDRMTEELRNCGWDDPLPQRYLDEWTAWKESLTGLSEVKIPRCVIPSYFMDPTRELHVFCDASDSAIGHVMYVKSINADGRIHVAFLTSNSKVAPRAATTTPRMELCAAVDAVINTNNVIMELAYQPSSIIYYSDSTAVLGYIFNNTSRFSRYVTNRTAIIRNLSSTSQWKYVPTTDNPADIASRPQAPRNLESSSWFSGPTFLSNEGYCLPEPHISTENLVEEVKQITIIATSLQEPTEITLMCERVNNWTRALGSMQTTLQAVKKFKSPRKSRFEPTAAVAAKCLIRNAQQSVYEGEFKALKRQQCLPENHLISKLSPFLDEDSIIRVGGRLKNSRYPNDRKHPILLPEDHIVTELILRYYHERVAHQGRHLTHGSVRDHGYHVMNGAKRIKNLINNCTVCRKLRASTSSQVMADLPSDRLEEAPPFTNTGLDVFGPYVVHDGMSTRGRSASKKVWVTIFVCLVTRAIHLELLNGLDTSSFRNALSRFIALRGVCSVLRSDNGTNFVATKRQLDSACQINVDEIKGELLSKTGCEWRFNPPRASHCGGAWERKIGCVKRVLDYSLTPLKSRSLTRDEFSTLLQEAAAIVNNTPMWEVSNHPDDPSPLSPASLLTLRDAPNPPDVDSFSEADVLAYGKRRWRRVKFLSEQFWVRWRRNYLQQLQTRHKWKLKQPCAAVGDVVLIRNKNSKRNEWPMARVSEVFPSEDGLVRRVRLLLPARDGKPGRYLDRSIHDTVLLVKSSLHKSDYCN